MATVKMHEAKSQLSRLVARAEAGEEIILARGADAVAKIVPLKSKKKQPREPGALKHLRGNLPADLFLEPLSDDELEAWEGKYSFDESA